MTPAPEPSASTLQPQVSVVVPVYRSEGCLKALVEAVAEALGSAGLSYEMVLVNDCSPDQSWKVIEDLCHVHPNVIAIDLRRNFGQNNTILTGLRFARGRYHVIMDDDLQHDPRDIPRLVDALEREEADVVYADFRTMQQKLWKNLGSWFNGKIAEWVVSKPRGIYLSPYKVIRREVAELICRYDGPYPYVDGLLFQVTARVIQIPCEHRTRFAGSSTYTFTESLRVWARHAFSFSVHPLRLVTWFGFVFAALGIVFAVWVICYRLLFPEDFPDAALGWASLIVTQLVLGGIQMFFFGILGEYAGRTYLKVSNKPQATIRQVLNARPEERPIAADRDAALDRGGSDR